MRLGVLILDEMHMRNVIVNNQNVVFGLIGRVEPVVRSTGHVREKQSEVCGEMLQPRVGNCGELRQPRVGNCDAKECVDELTRSVTQSKQ